jgi:hypothetical protein
MPFEIWGDIAKSDLATGEIWQAHPNYPINHIWKGNDLHKMSEFTQETCCE